MKISKIFMLLIPFFICGMHSQEKVIEKYENGNLKFEGYSINKVLDSVYKEYYENGNLKAEGFYKDCKYETNRRKIYILSCGIRDNSDNLISGTRHGSYKEYYRNGKLKSISNFHCGLRQGNFYDYYENGNLETQEFYFEDKIKSSQSYNQNGNIEETDNFEYNFKKTRDYKTTNHKEFYENGDLKIEKTLINNSKNGVYREYFENGNDKI